VLSAGPAFNLRISALGLARQRYRESRLAERDIPLLPMILAGPRSGR
jgi:hypothetical protein